MNPQPPVLETGALPIELRSSVNVYNPERALLPLDLMRRASTRTLAKLLELNLGNSAHDVHGRAIIEVIALRAL